MKKSKVKRFDLGGYASGVQGAYADSLGRQAKKDREDRMALDMQDAIEPVYPLENLALGAPNAVRKGVVAGGRALSNAAKDAAERALARQSTAEGLPTSAALRRALGENNPKVVTTKGNFEEFAGIRGRFKPSKNPEVRNEILRKEAEDAGIPYKEYLKGRGAARAEGVAPGVHWRDLLAKGGKVKTYAKGGKVGTVMHEFKAGKLKSSSGQKVTNPKQAIAIAMSEAGKKMKKYVKGGDVPDGDVLSNRDIGKRDPSLNKRKSTAPFTMDEMKGGLSTEELNKKTRPFDKATEGKYAAGGKVKKMANGGMFGSGAGTAPARGGALPTYNVSRDKSRDMSRIIANLPTRGRKMDMDRALANLPGFGSAVRGGMPAPDMRALAGLGSMAGMKKGGKVEESKKMVKKEVEFFKKKKAPKAMIKHEEAEGKGMKRGGKMMKFAKGGSIDGCAQRGKTKVKRVKM